MRLSTEVTPGADHAARSASSFSAQERTVPVRITLLPCVSTLIRFASVSTLRSSACSIFCLISDGVTRGLTLIRLTTPFDARQPADDPLCVLLLILPLNLTLESDP